MAALLVVVALDAVSGKGCVGLCTSTLQRGCIGPLCRLGGGLASSDGFGALRSVPPCLIDVRVRISGGQGQGWLGAAG